MPQGMSKSALRRGARSSKSFAHLPVQLPTPESEPNDDSESIINENPVESGLKIRVKFSSQKRKFIDYSADLAANGAIPTKKHLKAKPTRVLPDHGDEDEPEIAGSNGEIPVTAHVNVKAPSQGERHSALFPTGEDKDEIESSNPPHIVAPTAIKIIGRKKRSSVASHADQQENEILRPAPVPLISFSSRTTGRRKRAGAIVSYNEEEQGVTDLELESVATTAPKNARRRKRASASNSFNESDHETLEPVSAPATVISKAPRRQKRPSLTVPLDQSEPEILEPISLAAPIVGKFSGRKKRPNSNLYVSEDEEESEIMDSESRAALAYAKGNKPTIVRPVESRVSKPELTIPPANSKKRVSLNLCGVRNSC